MIEVSEARPIVPVDNISVLKYICSFVFEFLGTHLLIAHISLVQDLVIVVAIEVFSIIMMIHS